jgi:hypothetical protein
VREAQLARASTTRQTEATQQRLREQAREARDAVAAQAAAEQRVGNLLCSYVAASSHRRMLLRTCKELCSSLPAYVTYSGLEG